MVAREDTGLEWYVRQVIMQRLYEHEWYGFRVWVGERKCLGAGDVGICLLRPNPNSEGRGIEDQVDASMPARGLMRCRLGGRGQGRL